MSVIDIVEITLALVFTMFLISLMVASFCYWIKSQADLEKLTQIVAEEVKEIEKKFKKSVDKDE